MFSSVAREFVLTFPWEKYVNRKATRLYFQERCIFLALPLSPAIDFANILRAAFSLISFCQKNYKPKLDEHKNCAKHFCTKKLLIKCWWNRPLLTKSERAKNRINQQMGMHHCCYSRPFFRTTRERKIISTRQNELNIEIISNYSHFVSYSFTFQMCFEGSAFLAFGKSWNYGNLGPY